MLQKQMQRTKIPYWKQEFKKDIERKMQASTQEYNKYKKTKKTIYLQQAGNKLFSITENYMMIKYGKRKFSYKSIYDLVKSDERDEELLREALNLHYFFYNGKLHMPIWMAVRDYKKVRDKLN
ncbi:MAG: hypothetical protein DRN66_03755 [Candidatus Nanohalarchaeota archaeon]|nr:MAG: hypothetical protein DRN66_03755 [Candidatus Nanohaloarchaeota archaeon]